MQRLFGKTMPDFQTLVKQETENGSLLFGKLNSALTNLHHFTRPR